RRPSNDYAHFHFPPPLFSLSHTLSGLRATGAVVGSSPETVLLPLNWSVPPSRSGSSSTFWNTTPTAPGELVSASDFEGFEIIFCLRFNNRVALEACVQACNEGHDLSQEGNEIIREACKWIPD
ncbi:hypothetical protein H5410_033847, partial [Solanum commersonii]